MSPTRGTDVISAIIVKQWLDEWDEVKFNSKDHRSKPDPNFFLFALPAVSLRILSGIFRRSTKGRKSGTTDLGIQRRHDPSRSQEIGDFVKFGFPWSDLSESRRKSGEFLDLRKPGWLPTAIVVNILKAADVRGGARVGQSDLIKVDTSGRNAVIRLPEGTLSGTWSPSALPPIEVIDGQHRLWAFDPDSDEEEMWLPVVAFHGLDISWQAYLFWTINIKPKRINPSLAFDLYPLLRTEDWLQRFHGHSIYRETRAQELTQALWSHPKSPWEDRINMLGEPGHGGVTQAAWIRSLMSSFVKAWEGPGVKIGGLFGAPILKDLGALPWSRAQQAAFLIELWRLVADAVQATDSAWSKKLRKVEGEGPDAAFAGPHTLLNTDQGVRGVLQIANDLCFLGAEALTLGSWSLEPSNATDEEAVDAALKSLKKQPVHSFVTELAAALAKFDWRAASAPGLSDAEKTEKLVFRGSGGYRELRRQLLRLLEGRKDRIGEWAKEAVSRLRFDR